jgi:hypothetical protein
VLEAAHHDELLARGRCGRCAELVSPVELIRGGSCRYCASPLVPRRRGTLEKIERSQRGWRLLGYGLVGLASFVAAFVPLLQVVVQIAALFILHVVVLRGALRWLSPARRALARISLKIFGACLGVMALLVNVAVAPLIGVSALVLGLFGPLMTAAYVEGGLVILRRRLRWEADGEPLKGTEWAIPVAVLVALLALGVAVIAISAAVIHLMASAEIPGVSELALQIAEVLP